MTNVVGHFVGQKLNYAGLVVVLLAVQIVTVRKGGLDCSDFPSLEPRLSVLDFVSQLWRKVGFFSKAARQNPERKAWVRGYDFPVTLSEGGCGYRLSSEKSGSQTFTHGFVVHTLSQVLLTVIVSYSVEV